MFQFVTKKSITDLAALFEREVNDASPVRLRITIITKRLCATEFHGAAIFFFRANLLACSHAGLDVAERNARMSRYTRDDGNFSRDALRHVPSAALRFVQILGNCLRHHVLGSLEIRRRAAWEREVVGKAAPREDQEREEEPGAEEF